MGKSLLVLVLVVVLVCPALADPGASVGHSDAQLLSYVQRVLTYSDDARTLLEDLQLSRFGVEQAESQFRTVVRPIADLAVDSTMRPRTGIEFSKRTRYGIDLSTGYASDGLGSDSNARSFARMSLPVFRHFGRAVNELPLTKAQLQDERRAFEVDRRLQHLIGEAVANHVALVLIGKVEEQAEHAVQRAARHVASAQARQSVGLVSKVDVHRAELGRLERVEAHEQAMVVAEMRREEYAELAQLDVAHVRAPSRLPELRPETDWPFMPSQRVEWHVQRLDERLAELDLRAAERRVLPDIRFEVAWLGTHYGDTFGESLRDQRDVYFSMRLNSDLDFASKRRNIRMQKITFDRIRRAGRTLERRLLREVRQAEAAVSAEERRLQLAALRRSEAEDALEVALARFERGIASNLGVIDAEASLAGAELGSLNTQGSYVSAVIGLALARGELSLPWLQNALQDVQLSDQTDEGNADEHESRIAEHRLRHPAERS